MRSIQVSVDKIRELERERDKLNKIVDILADNLTEYTLSCPSEEGVVEWKFCATECCDDYSKCWRKYAEEKAKGA